MNLEERAERWRTVSVWLALGMVALALALMTPFGQRKPWLVVAGVFFVALLSSSAMLRGFYLLSRWEKTRREWEEAYSSSELFREWLDEDYRSFEMPRAQYLLLGFLSRLPKFPTFTLDDVNRAAYELGSSFDSNEDPAPGPVLIWRAFAVLVARGEIVLKDRELFTLKPFIHQRVLPHFKRQEGLGME